MSARLLIPAADVSLGWIVVDREDHLVTIIELPDLSLTELMVPNRQLDEDEIVRLNVTVANLGRLNVTDAYIVLYEITFGLSNKEIDRIPVDLPSGKTLSLWVNWTVRAYTRSIKAVVSLSPGLEDDNPIDNEVSKEIHVISNKTVVRGSGEDSYVRTGVVITSVAAGSIILISIASLVWSSDAARYSILTAGIPLYSKLRPEHLLGNKLRRRIYVYVQNHPGEHFRSILVNLNLKNGTLAHHLYTLEKENLIRSHRDGLYRRFYPAGFKIDDSPLDLTPIQRRILETISHRPGVTQKEISEELALSTSTVNYNIKVIKEKRLLDIRREGKFTKLYANKLDT